MGNIICSCNKDSGSVVANKYECKLPKCCYEGMFYNCTSLTTAPQLQATSLEISCYSHMFGFCTSLTIAPKLGRSSRDKLPIFTYRWFISDGQFIKWNHYDKTVKRNTGSSESNT